MFQTLCIIWSVLIVLSVILISRPKINTKNNVSEIKNGIGSTNQVEEDEDN